MEIIGSSSSSSSSAYTEEYDNVLSDTYSFIPCTDTLIKESKMKVDITINTTGYMNLEIDVINWMGIKEKYTNTDIIPLTTEPGDNPTTIFFSRRIRRYMPYTTLHLYISEGIQKNKFKRYITAISNYFKIPFKCLEITISDLNATSELILSQKRLLGELQYKELQIKEHVHYDSINSMQHINLKIETIKKILNLASIEKFEFSHFGYNSETDNNEKKHVIYEKINEFIATKKNLKLL